MLVAEPPGHALHCGHGLAVQPCGVCADLSAGGAQDSLDGEFEVQPGHGAGRL